MLFNFIKNKLINLMKNAELEITQIQQLLNQMSITFDTEAIKKAITDEQNNAL